MKRTHVILLVVTCILAVLSVYSLTAINKAYKISFQWYSPYNGVFSNEERDTLGDRWQPEHYFEDMRIEVLTKREALNMLPTDSLKNASDVSANNFEKYVLIYCSLGKVSSREYRIKVTDIVQKGNVVEVKLSANSPAKTVPSDAEKKSDYLTEDIVRIDKNSFPSKGKIYFVFKNQYGKKIGQQYCEI